MHTLDVKLVTRKPVKATLFIFQLVYTFFSLCALILNNCFWPWPLNLTLSLAEATLPSSEVIFSGAYWNLKSSSQGAHMYCNSFEFTPIKYKHQHLNRDTNIDSLNFSFVWQFNFDYNEKCVLNVFEILSFNIYGRPWPYSKWEPGAWSLLFIKYDLLTRVRLE